MKRDSVMRNPQDEFRTPERVLEDQELSDDQKIALLLSWRLDLLELQTADAENMQSASDDSGDVAAKLASVTDALETLGADPRTGRQS